ncbi:MAG TPA: hypothetical protein VJX68_02515 [Candidatus Binatus sp.]|uniref:hypothetical protein n=1 Tax=Candidatus Binatus sp. TaxID=2811406 RepID=UPI002B4951C4|nr:hypothetical protein [Candidatus Binatus sp.]HKN12043.1 hypothetical protein [Candidatus Binatus sp.]
MLADQSNNTLDELSKGQLAAGSANIAAPNIVISSSDSNLDGPNFIAFDKAGNAWVDNEAGNTIAEFSKSQLASGGSKLATVVLSDDGSGTSISEPGEIAFDKNGNLWVPNYGAHTVVEYAKGQLASSGNPAPTVKLNSAVLAGEGPFSAVFDSKGDLLVMDYLDGTIAKFAASQLKTSGAPVPKVIVTGSVYQNYQIIFGPAS